MSRTTGRSARAKHKIKPISARQRRKSIQRSQVKFGKSTIQVRRAVSARGRTHMMEEAGMEQPQQPQNVLMESTAIRKFKYWTTQKRLRIWFVSKGVYDYFNVPESVVLDLAQSQSKGRYFHDNIYGYWSGKPGRMVLHPDYQFRRIR